MTTDTLDCGHAPSTEHTYNGKPAWQFVLDGERRICHACADARILECGHTPSPHSHITTGYGTDASGARSCYACCADKERAAMLASGRAVLYLSGAELTDWPGQLRFPVFGSVRRSHGWGFGRRYQISTGRFTGPDGKLWRFRNAGDNDIAHCARID